MISTLDPRSLSLKQNLDIVSVFASLAESSLSQIMVARTTVAFLSSKLSEPFSPQSESRYFVIARTPRGRSFPHIVHYAVHLQQQCQGPEDCNHFPNRIPCLGLAFSPSFHIPACRIILHYILPNCVAFPFSWSITPLKNSNIRM